MAEWRPSRPALAQACALVRQHASAAVRRRLAILDALVKTPDAPLTEIARHAVTRTRVVRQLLRRWRLEGIDSLTQFGRPADLDVAQLNELERATASVPLRSLIEVGDWLTKKSGVKFSRPTLRHYCQQCGFDLPGKFEVLKAEKPIRRRQPWTPAQVAGLKQLEPKLKRRVAAILRAGTEANFRSTALPVNVVCRPVHCVWICNVSQAGEQRLCSNISAGKTGCGAPGFGMHSSLGVTNIIGNMANVPRQKWPRNIFTKPTGCACRFAQSTLI